MADCRRRLLLQPSRSLLVVLALVSALAGLRSLRVAQRHRQRQSCPGRTGAARQKWRFGMCVPGCQEAVRHALSRRGFFNGALAASFAATAMAPEMALAAPPPSFTSLAHFTHPTSPPCPTLLSL